MAPQSLRAMLAYVGNLLSQIPGLGAGLDRPTGFAPSSSSSEWRGPAVDPYVPLSGAPSCPLDGPLSCHNNTPIVGDSCCFVHPGGRMLLTQFWDEDVHAGGSEEDWTIHGLWPDLCNGGFDSFCGMTPHYNNITEILKAHGQDELVAFMDRYWLADRGSNAHLWAHEYNKHATCINTLAPACYSPSSSSPSDDDSATTTTTTSPGEMAVVDYFTRATALYRTLDVYTALARAGITPKSRTTYPLADVRAALERFVGGGRVVLRCAGKGSRRDVLREAWFHYFVKGSLQSGEFVPAKDLGPGGDKAENCAPWVRYLPKRTRREL